MTSLVVFALIVLALTLAWRAVPSDEELAARLAVELEARLGVKTSVGAVSWQLRPVPQVTVENVRTEQDAPISVARAVFYPEISALLRRQIQVKRLEMDGVVLPQLSLQALKTRFLAAAAADKPDETGTLLGRLLIRDLTWINRLKIPVVYRFEGEFDPRWRPRVAELSRPGAPTLTRLRLDRKGSEDRWETQLALGGGSANGWLALDTAQNGDLKLSGELAPKAIDVVAALAAFDRKSVIAGKAGGTTVINASGKDWGALGASFHTRTVFNVAPATVLRFDLDKAIRTLGAEHGGQTRLDSLSGQMDTQSTPGGMQIRYTNLKARSGALSATGQATLLNRKVDGEFSIDLVDGLVGVPLKVSGPTHKIQVSLPKAAVAGAIAGTAVLPGIGTAIGARIGAALGQLFGSDEPPSAAPVTR